MDIGVDESQIASIEAGEVTIDRFPTELASLLSASELDLAELQALAIELRA